MMTMDSSSLAVLVIATGACICDIRTRRIPNALTFGAAAAACVFALLFNGLSALGSSAAGWLIAVAIFFPVFALGGMGAGDVKLLGAIGAWVGASEVVHLALYTALAGGVMAVVVALYRSYLIEALRNLWALVNFWRRTGLQQHPELTLRAARGPKLAYAIPIAVGAVATLWLR